MTLGFHVGGKCLAAVGCFSPDFSTFLDNMLKKEPEKRLPPEVLLGAPWLRRCGATSFEVAVQNTRSWVKSLSS